MLTIHIIISFLTFLASWFWVKDYINNLTELERKIIKKKQKKVTPFDWVKFIALCFFPVVNILVLLSFVFWSDDLKTAIDLIYLHEDENNEI